MKRGGVFLLVLILFFIVNSVYALEPDPELGDSLEGQELPDYAKKIFGDQKINVYIDEVIFYHIVIEDGVIIEFDVEEINNPTMNMYSSELTFQEIQDSEDPGNAFINAINEDKITYKAVGFFNKIRFSFINFGRNILKLFTREDKQSGDSRGFSFEDVVILWDGELVSNVGWGRATIEPEKVLGNLEIGYFNLYTDEGWVIENLYLNKEDGIIPTTYFYSGESYEELSAHLEVSEEPLEGFSDGERQVFKMGQVFEIAIGLGVSGDIEESKSITGNVVDNSLSDELNVNIPNMDIIRVKEAWEERERQKRFDEEARVNRQDIPRPELPAGRGRRGFETGENWAFTLPNVINVEAALNQCAPMSIANSLQFLEETFGINVPNDHVQGEGGRGGDSLVEALDIAMNRNVTSRRNGRGLTINSILNGKFKYLNENGLQNALVNKHQGRGRAGVGIIAEGDYSSNEVTSRDDGAIVTWGWICQQIQEEEDVEIAFVYEDDAGDVTGGHAVRVFECGVTQGRPWIGYAHDRDQSDDTKGLETVRVYLDDRDDDGKLNIITNKREVEFAISESPA